MRVISSPGYPNTYPNDVECFWIFEKEMPVFDVVVVIEDFHTEEPDGGANCTYVIKDVPIIIQILADSVNKKAKAKKG